MKKLLVIFNTEFKKMIILQKRYILSILSDLLVYYILFMGMYFLIKNKTGILS